MKRWWFVAGAFVLLVVGAAGGYLAGLPQVNSAWIPVIAALGASLLTTVAVVGVELLRQHDASHSAAQGKRREAYSQFLAASGTFINLATEVHTIRRLATGLLAAARIKDGVEFVKQFDRELEPLMHAWSSVWLSGSGAAIRAANRLMDATTSAMSMASAQGTAVPSLVARFVGERWTEEQERDFHEALRKLGLLRGEFADVVRRELREPSVDLFAGIDRSESADANTPKA
jgi:hypothetical protein